MKNFSDEQINAYFLGKMPTKEAETFEFEVASDAELDEHVQVIERELIDNYLRENLPAEDADCFEKNYLTTETRRRRLIAAKALWQIVAEPPAKAAATAAAGYSFRQKIFGKGNALRLAFACAALLVCGAIAFYLLSLKIEKADIAEVKAPTEKTEIETPPLDDPDQPTTQSSEDKDSKTALNESVNQGKETIKPPTAEQEIQPEPKSKTEQNKPGLAMVVKLMPGTLRDSDETEKSVMVAPNVKSIKFLLNPAGDPNRYKSFRVFVKSPEDGTVFAASNLNSLSVTMPAAKLENRTYILFLEGENPSNEFESIAEYTFRVRRD